jgi:hypothetical protein
LKVFTRGKRGYVRVFPGKKRMIFAATALQPVQQGLSDALALFAGMSIQNNLSETINNILRQLACLKGIRSMEKLETKIRTFFIMRNDMPKITADVFTVQHRANAFFNYHTGKAFHNDLSCLGMELTVHG